MAFALRSIPAPRRSTSSAISRSRSRATRRSPATAVARYNALIVESRPGDWRLEALGDQRLLAARCSLKLRRENGALKIVEKKTVLTIRRQPIDALTVII